jgi:hypothetical protein
MSTVNQQIDFLDQLFCLKDGRGFSEEALLDINDQ